MAAVSGDLKPELQADVKIERLSAASLRRTIEPDVEVSGEVGTGAVLPPDLLSVAGLDLELSPEQLITLSREEVASIVEAGLRFEAILMAGFSFQLALQRDYTDPRVVYALHEMGEETRHSRLFSRLLDQLQPTAPNPLDKALFRAIQRVGMGAIIRRPALLDVLVLAGEEIPDLLQKKAAEHPDTDPFLAKVNRYHRQEEARHLAFARTVLPEEWRRASWTDRFAVRHIAPLVIRDMFRLLVHPGVYETIGLPGWATWRAANRSPERVALRHEATRPVLDAMLQAEVVTPGRVPRGWRDLCGVDRQGTPAA
ncbi:MAG TPA: diiron oxygenase [Acidimicrobiales bacterium]